MAAALEALPWVQDGLTSYEESKVGVLRRLARTSPPTIEALMRKPWMAAGDDPNYVAYPVLLRVTEMADFDEGLALQAVGMTFLDTLD